MKVVTKQIEVLVPEGQYVLGDPCYAVPDDLWNDLLDSCQFFSFPIGLVQKKGESFVYHVLGFSTAYGDGCYEGSNGRQYPVDAGLIGLVPIQLAEEGSYEQGDVLTFTKPTICASNGKGELKFGNVVIDTDYAQCY